MEWGTAMKKIVCVCLLLFLLLSLGACSQSKRDVTIDYGNSEQYTNQEMDRAITVIKDKFLDLKDCVLHSLQYAGDEVCNDNIEYCNSLDQNEDFTECMVFHSSFQSPPNGGGAWEANRTYTWDWYLAKNGNGDWILLTYGY